MALAVVAVLDLLYLSWAGPLGRLTPAPVAPGALGFALLGGLNTAVLLRPGLGASGQGVVAVLLRAADALVRRIGLAVALAGLLVAALELRLLVLAREPVDQGRADMLVLLMRAMDRLLAGDNPYIVYELPYPMPLTYLPALWAPMAPAHWLGVDVRLVQAVAACAVGVVIAGARWGAADRLGASPAARLGLAAGFLLCPATVAFVAIGHTALYWLYLIVLLAALGRHQWLVAGLSAGFCAMARQTIGPALLPVLLVVWRAAPPAGRRRFGVGALLALAVGGVILTADPVFALWGNIRWYAALDPYADPARRWWILNNPGFGSVLYPLGLGNLVGPVGIVALALALAHAWRRVADAASAARSVGLALLAVTLAVPAPFRYEFIPVVLVVIAAALMTPRPTASRRVAAGNGRAAVIAGGA